MTGQTNALCRLTYKKYGRMRFIGHLDLIRLFQRAIKRAQLPVEYSKGFNPHQLIGFALPLPLGMSGQAECMDIRFSTMPEITNIIDLINKELPDGLKVTSARICDKNEKSAAALVCAARYRITLNPVKPDLYPSLDKLMSEKEIFVSKKSKSKTENVDIRPDIHNLSWESNGESCVIEATLSAGSGRYLKPGVLIEYLSVDNSLTAEFERIELLKLDGHNFVPLM